VVATYHGDHAYCFDITGAAQPSTPSHPSSSGSTCGGSRQQQPFDLFAHPLAVAALAAGGGGGHAQNGSTSSGGMSDLPGMMPAAAEREKADGNLHLFSKQVSKVECQQGSGVLPACKATSSSAPANYEGLPSIKLPYQSVTSPLVAHLHCTACSTTKL
jgi:hypothetical protein